MTANYKTSATIMSLKSVKTTRRLVLVSQVSHQ